MKTIRLRPRRRASFALAVLTALAAHPASADGWSLFATLSQRFEADSNLKLEPDSPGVSFGSTTSAGLNIVSETPRTKLTISPRVTGTLFSGSSYNSSNRISPRLSTRLSHRVGTVDLSGGLTGDIRPTTFSEIGLPDSGIPDLDLIDQDATRISAQGDLGLGYDLDPRTRLSVGPFFRVVRFTDDADTLSPSTTFGVNANVSHKINERIAAQAGVGARHVDIDGRSGSETSVFSVTTGLIGQISPRFSIDGRVGVNFLDTEDALGTSSTGLGFTGSVVASYAVRDDLSLSLTANQDVEPSSNGELETRSSIGASGLYEINRRESIDMGFGYSRQASASTFSRNSLERNQLYASLGYSLAVTPDITARIGYLGRWIPDSRREATSHKVFLSFSRSFALSP